jgi:phosphatidylglycerol---prolipoprotein diacylglyceryl transferase
VAFHLAFDLLASLSAFCVTLLCYHWRLREAAQRIESAGTGYVLALVAGAAAGGYGAGSLNLWLSGESGAGRSIAGALAGAILAIEFYKRSQGISGSTGLLFVPAFATTVAVGRIGCFLSGIGDNTHGVVTSLPWGHDFGDGLLRHPVQLYESAAMLGFLGFTLFMLGIGNAYFMRSGFYLLVLFYAAQRFFWEFLKPYGTLAGPFNLFHFICAGLICYAVWMLRRTHERAPA